jgi:hypothetical protein
MKFKMFLLEEGEQTMQFWHGGDLDSSFDGSQRKGRHEYGFGLYVTTHYGTAIKYAKGSRKLYRLTVAKGNDASDVLLPIADVLEFTRTHVSRPKYKEIEQRFVRWTKDNMISANIFNNILSEDGVLKSTYGSDLVRFLVEHGVDYLIVRNAFGWHETMLVIFNMKKVLKLERINSKDKIETFDLPTEWK